MSLEIATYIHQLQATNPTVADKVKQGDDHLRMIKASLKNTFPNVQGPVTVSHTTLNQLPADVAAQIAILFANREAKGTIKMHDVVNVPAIPTGWSLCDGSEVSGYGTVPDLRNRFIRGWGDEAAGAAGGATSATTSNNGGHAHVGGATGATALTEAQLPVISFLTKGSFAAGSYDGGGNPFMRIQAGDAYIANGLIQPIGGGQTHSHPAGTTEAVPGHDHTVTTVPPYYRLVFIVKTSDFVLP
jgi:hypothetical protein